MRYLFAAFLSLQSLQCFAIPSLLPGGNDPSQVAQMQAGEQAYYARIHDKIASALSQRLHVEFYVSENGYRGGPYTCSIAHATMIGTVSVVCADYQNNPVVGLSQNDLRKALGCFDYYSYFVPGDISSKCRGR